VNNRPIRRLIKGATLPDYTVRIVLHGATAKHYQLLHDLMGKAGARRTVGGSNGILFDLPDGEYVLANSLPVSKVMEAVADIAGSVKSLPRPSVLVTETIRWAWQLRPVPGQS